MSDKGCYRQLIGTWSGITVSVTEMTKRKAVWLILAHAALTAAIIFVEEFRSWNYWEHLPPKLEATFQDRSIETPRWMTAMKAWVTHSSQPQPSAPDEWLQSLDFWPPLSRKTLYVTEWPVVLTFGRYKHPLSLTQGAPLLPISLLPGMARLRLHRRILACEAGLLLAIMSFWIVVVSVLMRFSNYARWLGLPIFAITATGVFSATVSLSRSVSCEIIGGVSLLIGLLAWAAVCVSTITLLALQSAAWLKLRSAPTT